MRSWILAAALVAIGATIRADADAPVWQVQTLSRESPNRHDFPIFDRMAWSMMTGGHGKKSARDLAARSPDDPSVPKFLASRALFDEALVALRRLVERRPDLIAPAFDGFSLFTYPDPSAKARLDSAREIVALAKQRLATLPREAAANAAYVLMGTENQLSSEGSPGGERRRHAFLAEYAGTEAALLAQVDAIGTGRLTPATLDSLDAFVTQHPGTTAAAKALYQKGFNLAKNSSALRLEPRGTDPTPRFNQVLGIVRRLESGEFPRSTWVDLAPSLVWGFSASEPTFSPSSLDAITAASVEFAAMHWPEDPRAVLESEMDYALSSRLARWLAPRGDPIAAVEKSLRDLGRLRPQSAATIQYMLATFYLRELVELPARSVELLQKSTNILDHLRKTEGEPLARYALATIASIHFYERAYPRARDAYREYLKRYPGSDWAWLAMIRLGQSYEHEGDLALAAVEFRRAATEHSSVPPARVLGWVYAAEALAGLGRVPEALELASNGLAGWDDDYGPEYRPWASQRRRPDQDPYDFSDPTVVDKALLAVRISQLRTSAALQGGGAIERARWHLDRNDIDGAREILMRARAQQRAPEFERASRALINRAELERALAVPATGGDQQAALERLATAPFDFHVTAAKMARATLRARDGLSDAGQLMETALTEWSQRQPGSSPTPPNSLEADVAAIRAVVFRPSGDGIYATTRERWNAFNWPTIAAPFHVVNADALIKLASGEARRLTVRVPVEGPTRVLYLDTAEIEVLNLVMRRIGGTARREPTRIMETPNQPAGAAVDVRAFWNQFFPTRQGHWSGWVFETYPTITDITFTDAARTRAAARVVVGYSGCTVMLIKEDGRWRAVELNSFWVT